MCLHHKRTTAGTFTNLPQLAHPLPVSLHYVLRTLNPCIFHMVEWQAGCVVAGTEDFAVADGEQ